ncbi:hypothetical protein U1Q18_025259 [Sarracenia purpurea var. burkii]
MIDESLDDKLKEDDEFVDDYLESSLAFSGNTYCNLYNDGMFLVRCTNNKGIECLTEVVNMDEILGYGWAGMLRRYLVDPVTWLILLKCGGLQILLSFSF